ncbi:MAG: peroxiredoxin family protein [Muribaculaceae bacterium]|nr:peroxiredoxin family protein [Muribaculaceae bacterium]
MNKTLKYIVFCIVIVVMVGIFAVRVNREDTDPAAVPHIDTAGNAAGTVDISKLKGRYVLVNFWDSHNAVSRIAAGEYDKFLRSHPRLNVKLLSVNTDDNRKLFDEIVKHDGLDGSTQYHISDTRAGGHTPGFQPDEGYASYLLNPEGKVVAVNPSVETLEDILEK